MNTFFDDKSKVWDQRQDRQVRAKTIADKIFEKVPVSEEWSVLEFGCGTGLLGFHFLGRVKELTFADTSKGMLEQVTQKLSQLPLHHANVLNLETQPMGSGYDLVVSLMVLHHIENVEAKIAELARALTAGGYLCLSDLDREDGSFHGKETVPHNGFEREDLLRIYGNCGLAMVDCSTGFVNRKLVDGVEKEFPAFLIIGKK